MNTGNSMENKELLPKQKMNAVLSALSNHVPVTLKDGTTIVMIDGKLCIPMYKWTVGKENETEEYFSEFDIPFNMFVDEVNKFNDGDIVNIVWMSSQASERIDRIKEEMSEEEFKTFFFNAAEMVLYDYKEK